MFVRLRKLVLLSLLLVMPVQGMAAVLGTLACPAEGQHQSAAVSESVMHVHAAHNSARDHEHSEHQHSGNSSGAGEHSNHLCCHNITSAPPTLISDSPKSELPVFVSSIFLLHTLFIPEQPQRPPRS